MRDLAAPRHLAAAELVQDLPRLLFRVRVLAHALAAGEVAQRVDARSAGWSGRVCSEVITESRPKTVEYHGMPAEITFSPSTST